MLRSPILLLVLAIGLGSAVPSAAADARQDQKQARKLYSQALKLRQRSQFEAALEKLQQAAALDPVRVEYTTAREIVRQQAVTSLLEQGAKQIEFGERKHAAGLFQKALALDPNNVFAQDHLRIALGQTLLSQTAKLPSIRPVIDSDPQEVVLSPGGQVQNIEFRGDARGLFQRIGAAFGISVSFDDSFTARPLRFKLDGVDFFKAMTVASTMTKSWWIPISPAQVLVLPDTQAKRLEMEGMVMRSFLLPGASAQEVSDFAGLLRTMLDVRFVTPQPAASKVVVRAPRYVMRAIEGLVSDVTSGRDEVLVEVQVFELSKSALRNLGVDLPLQFRVFNVASELRSILSQVPGGQELIDQFLASGAITDANAAALAALFASLQQGQTPLSQPFAVFGGGLTLTGIVIPPITLNFQQNSSVVRSVQRVTLRSMEGAPATLRSGIRYPIVVSSFTSTFDLEQLRRLGQQAGQQISPDINALAFAPQINYEDIGITLKVTPAVTARNEIRMDLEMQLRALGAQLLNSIPVISNREFKGMITVKEGDMAMMVSNLEQNEQRAIRGMPVLSYIPGIRKLTSTESKQVSSSELLIMIRPYVLRRARPEHKGTETWISGQ